MSGLNQRDLVLNGSWNLLVVLDACRYDYFASEVPGFHRGKLTMAVSPASNTYWWLSRIWGAKKHDVRVYGSHPVLNSMGIQRRGDITGFIAANCFREIIDVWKFGWSEKDATVMPKSVTNRFLRDKKRRGFWDIPTILWYMQPHAPWVGATRITSKQKNLVNGSAYYLWKRATGKDKIDPIVVRRAYRDNLRMVMGHIREKLLPHVKEKKIVITSDHGELLGEHGLFDHPARSEKYRELIEVPWFELEG